MSSAEQHLSPLSLLKALWAHEALVKGRTRLWEMESGWEACQTEITCEPSQVARAGNGGWGWEGRQEGCPSHNTNKPVTRSVKICIVIY